MLQIIYASAATPIFKENMLNEILVKSREHNTAMDITGMLVYHSKSFLQVLEGPEEAVQRLYSIIVLDKRHKNCVLVNKSNLIMREFDNWSMGFIDTTKTSQDVAGFVEYKTKFPLLIQDPTQAKKILKAFQSGAWRQKIDY